MGSSRWSADDWTSYSSTTKAKTTDKILSQKDSKTVRNPVTKEKETI